MKEVLNMKKAVAVILSLLLLLSAAVIPAGAKAEGTFKKLMGFRSYRNRCLLRTKAHQLFEGALKKSGHEYFGGSYNLTHLEIGCAFRSQISN